MNFPGGPAPWIVKLSFAGFANGRADIGRAVMLIIPHEISGDANLARGMPCCFVGQIRPAKKARQLLDPSVVVKNIVLGSRCDFANDCSRVADLRGVFRWLFENFQMPIVIVDAGAIRRLRRPRVGHTQITG